MALTPEDLLSTPAGYATPEQLSSVQEMSKLLMQSSQGNQPITNKWQGPKLLADRAAAMMLMNRAGQQQQAGLDAFSRGTALTPPGSTQDPLAGMGQSSDIGLPQPGGTQGQPQSVASQSGGYGNLPPGAVDAIRKQEGYSPRAQWDVHQYSYGYGSKAPGPGAVATRSQSEELLNRDLSQAAAMVDQVNPRLDPGTRAALTDLTFNTGIGWSKQGLGQAVRAGDLQGIKQGLLQYQNVAGRPNPVIANRRQMDAGWIGQPGAQVAQAGPVPGGAGPPPPGSPAAMSGALARQQTVQASPQGQQVAAGARPAPGAIGPGVSSVGAPQFGPQYMPSNPQISRQQIFEIMRNPWGDPELKRQLYQQYMQQNQPVVTERPGIGRTIIPYGGRGGQPFTIPEVHTFESEGGPGTKTQVPYTYELGPGGQLIRKITPTEGMYPTQKEAPKETPPPEFNVPTRKPQSQNVPPTGGATPAAGTARPVQVASLGNTPLPPSMLTQPPPGGKGTQTDQAQPSPGAKGAQTAQYIDPYSKGLMQEQQDLSAQGAARTEAATANVKMFNEAYKGTQAAASTSRNNISELKLARELAGAPGFPAGLFAEGRLDLQKLQAWWGDNPRAGMEAQEFDKIMAGQGVDQLRTIWSGAGLGQVRLAEFQTIMKSLASRANTPEAIQSLIDIMIKAHERVGKVGELQNWFQKGYRYDDSGRLVKPPNVGAPTIVDWNDTLEKYINANPIIADADIKNFNKKYGSAKPEPEQTTYTNSKTGQPTPTTQPAPQDDPLQRAIEERTRRGR